jgi:hypothetical protein
MTVQPNFEEIGACQLQSNSSTELNPVTAPFFVVASQMAG